MADPFAGKLFGKAVPKAELGLVDMTDLAEIAVFLASPAASKMTGQALSVTGGISRALKSVDAAHINAHCGTWELIRLT